MNSDALTSSDTEFSAIDVSRLPNLVSRVKAIFFDLVIMLIVFTLTSVLIGKANDVSVFIKSFIAIAMFLMYDPLLTSFTGGTLGHKMMGLSVKRFHSPDQNISLSSAVLRFVVKSSLGWLSLLTVTSTKNKRAIHDTLSGSIVLRSSIS